MKTVGIFLPYYPHDSISSQSIDCLLSNILAGATKESDVKVVLAIPFWYQSQINTFLAERKIDSSMIELLKLGVFSYFIFLFPFFLGVIASQVLNIKSSFGVNWRVRKIFNSLIQFSVFRKYYDLFCNNELRNLIKKMNKRRDIQAWLVPSSLGWGIKGIKSKKIVIVSSVDQVEFPSLFPQKSEQFAYREIMAALASSHHIICYSENIKSQQLIKKCQFPGEKISVIHPSYMTLNQLFHERYESLWKDEAISILSYYQKIVLKKDKYLKEAAFSSMRYVLYAAESKKYSNILTLVKVFETLFRDRLINIKLVLVADFTKDNEVYAYIKQRKLEKEILVMKNIPDVVLAALNKLAMCSVNPTLFSGEFPPSFTQAYSVGTPSVMSCIEATSHVISDAKLKTSMLFDPYDIEDMANKIAWAVNNTNALYEMQSPLYQSLRDRTSAMVVKEYIDVIQAVAGAA